ncbi:hypothetical protein ACFE04_017359 [Oxalis oulophora]
MSSFGFSCNYYDGRNILCFLGIFSPCGFAMPPKKLTEQERSSQTDPEDLATYASSYEKSGFSIPLQVPYRTIGMDCGVTDPKIVAPTLLIMGEKDYALKFPGKED